ncbi:NADH dehydrogenase [ubiquinone] 1 beta subcomplex subunit 11, mitochondrial-like [Pteronotus mesoamericanus]|uniref:NADH dehydrogenase [ubiquinone] 1 beta subcomplex subunit 11, mitochondrial-like n=1 Tax=Pteronotus mesoamericanus TaxID=1884717 RepID=UPI0023EC0DF6|nr:NADH dehydrogenase [ubiquinone] 1 beta subcomplex subunit 11, mitochondrial-like [Pteronotus parnellii mesoamericanus]
MFSLPVVSILHVTVYRSRLPGLPAPQPSGGKAAAARNALAAGNAHELQEDPDLEVEHLCENSLELAQVPQAPGAGLWSGRGIVLVGFSILLLLGSSFAPYLPDNGMPAWAHPEAERLVKSPEAEGLPETNKMQPN